MKKAFITLFTLLLLGAILYFIYTNNKYEISYNNTFEINSNIKIKDVIKNSNNIEITNLDDRIDTSKLGEMKITIKLSNKKELYTTINIIDTEKPVISFNKKIIINKGEKIDLLKDVTVTDNSNEEIKSTVIGNYDINIPDTYQLQYYAKDSSNNEIFEDFTLIVKETTKNNNYNIKVNKTLNVVMIYSNDTLVKTFVCSAGNDTPLGTFETSDQYEYGDVVGGVYARYSTRIYKGILFHSVPYYTKPTSDNPYWNDLESEEYNKLGELASAGCIRLSVIDSKWIYDNIKKGTKVEIYESDTLPEGVTKPDAIKIDLNSENKGWDPTDPAKENPWNN